MRLAPRAKLVLRTALFLRPPLVRGPGQPLVSGPGLVPSPALLLALSLFLPGCGETADPLEGGRAAAAGAEPGSKTSSAAAELQAQGSTYHVAVKGSDANPGTAGSPFRTVRKAVTVARPGDAIAVHAGTYDGVVTIRRSGQPGMPIVLRPAGDGPVTLTAAHDPQPCSSTSPTRNRTIKILSGADHWTIQGFTIRGGIFISGANVSRITEAHARDRTLPGRGRYDPAAARTTLPSLGVDPADGIQILDNRVLYRGIHVAAGRAGRIERNEVAHIPCGIGSAIWLNAFSDEWVVRANYIHDLADAEKHWMHEGIRMGRASMYNLVEGNRIEDVAGVGRGVAVDVHAGWNVIRRNRATRTFFGFSEQVGGWGNVWEENVSEASGRSGFVIYMMGGSQQRDSDDTPAYVRMRCNVSRNEALALVIGEVKKSTFQSNSLPQIRLSETAREEWRSQGNTWNGSSNPPDKREPNVTTGCS
jgi:hypothetical protein